MRLANITAALMACAAFAFPAVAQETGAPAVAEFTGPQFRYQTGDITLPNKVATLRLGQ
jgi:hypothetical protein